MEISSDLIGNLPSAVMEETPPRRRWSAEDRDPNRTDRHYDKHKMIVDGEGDSRTTIALGGGESDRRNAGRTEREREDDQELGPDTKTHQAPVEMARPRTRRAANASGVSRLLLASGSATSHRKREPVVTTDTRRARGGACVACYGARLPLPLLMPPSRGNQSSSKLCIIRRSAAARSTPTSVPDSSTVRRKTFLQIDTYTYTHTHNRIST